jgi:hypothetical protein
MLIKIIGAGCPACRQLEANVRAWVARHHVEAQVERTDDLVEILNHHLTALPGLIVDDQLLLTGCPTQQRLDQVLTAALQII